MKRAVALLSMLLLLSVNAAYKNELNRSQGEIALEAFNFLDGIGSKDLNASQLQLYREGMKRLRELARVLNFKAYEGKESLEIAGDSECNEFYLLKVQDMALENARKACRQEAGEAHECIDYSSKIVRNIAGECQAFAMVHRVQLLK